MTVANMYWITVTYLFRTEYPKHTMVLNLNLDFRNLSQAQVSHFKSTGISQPVLPVIGRLSDVLDLSFSGSNVPELQACIPFDQGIMRDT